MKTISRSVWPAALTLCMSSAALLGCGDDEAGAEDPQREADAAVDAEATVRAGTRSTAGRGGAGGRASSAGGRAGAGGRSGAGGAGRDSEPAEAGTGDDVGSDGSAGQSGAGAGGAGANDAGASGDAGGSDTAGNASADGLNDAQIAAVLDAASRGELELASLAERQASSPTVLAFARSEVTAHGATRARQAALVETLSLMPQDNPISMQLSQEASTIATRLQAQAGAAFDVSFMEAQVALHTELLGILDDALFESSIFIQ